MFKELFYKYLLIFKPKKTENIPTKMLENTYISKYVSWLLLINVKFSWLKEEKVVKPPQNPTVNKITRDESMLEFLIDQPRAKPIKKHPNKFVRRVG